MPHTHHQESTLLPHARGRSRSATWHHHPTRLRCRTQGTQGTVEGAYRQWWCHMRTMPQAHRQRRTIRPRTRRQGPNQIQRSRTRVMQQVSRRKISLATTKVTRKLATPRGCVKNISHTPRGCDRTEANLDRRGEPPQVNIDQSFQIMEEIDRFVG